MGIFTLFYLRSGLAHIKFPGKEMRDFYPVFTLFNAWMGLIIFIFLGLSSKRFRFVLAKWWAMRVSIRYSESKSSLKYFSFRREVRVKTMKAKKTKKC